MIVKEIASRNDTVIEKFLEEYSINNKPIEVSFRNLLPELKKTERYTHLIHSYPAKLLLHIPYFFLNNSHFSKPNDLVLDPFSGTGTVLLESIIANRRAVGADANPLARLISEVKISSISSELLEINLKQILISVKRIKIFETPEIINCNYWFSESTIIQLSKLLKVINNLKDEKVKNFMLVAFSNCVKKVSYADQRVSVPVKLNPKRFEKNSEINKKIISRLKLLKTIDVIDKFSTICTENIKRNKELESANVTKMAKIISADARKLSSSLDSKSSIKKESVQLVITSPPYAGAQKYIRASSLNLGWTNLATIKDLLLLDKKNIGRENYKKSDINIIPTGINAADILINDIKAINPLRANIICQYILEMQKAFLEVKRVLKNNGYFVLIVGNNMVCNKEFNTQEYFTEYLKSIGLELQFKLIDDIKSYGLMTKRNKTADIISREWILVFKKN